MRMLQKEFLLRLIKKRGFTSGIEIGVLRGETVDLLLTCFDNLHMTSIDNSPQPEAFKVVNAFKDRFNIIVNSSDEAIKSIAGQRDFVWIDGDHHYEQVKRDILNYWPLVRIGGVIGGHDYCKDAGDVSRAVKEILGEHINTAEDGVWWVDKINAEIQK